MEGHLEALGAELRQAFGEAGFEVAAQPAEQTDAGLLAADGPDIVEVDLLSVARHAAAGRIADLSAHEARFDPRTHLTAANEAVRIDGRCMALPFSISVPTVLFHQGMYAAAGVSIPRTLEEWTDGLERLRRHYDDDPGFRSVWLPGRSWQVLASCIWGSGGRPSFHDGAGWRGGFELPGVSDGARFFRQLQQYAPEARDLAETDLRVAELFATGQAASVIGSADLHTSAVAADPSLASQLNAFPLPGRGSGRPGPVGLQGTALVVSARCRDVPKAAMLLGHLASWSWRSRIAQGGRVLVPQPIPEQLLTGPNPMLRAGAAAAREAAVAYPTAPGWSERPLLDFGRAILGGTDAMSAAVSANQAVAAEFGRSTG